MKIWNVVWITIICILAFHSVYAADNVLMGFQGYFINNTYNQTLESGTLQINISTTNSCNGDTYSETFNDPFVGGIADVMLGENVVLPMEYGEQYFLCSAVNGEQVSLDNFTSSTGEIDLADIDLTEFKNEFVPYTGATSNLNMGTHNVLIGDGNFLAPGLAFSSEPGTGLFKLAPSYISLAVGGGFIWTSTPTSFVVVTNLTAVNVLPIGNNLYDLGASNLYWNDLFVTNIKTSAIDATGHSYFENATVNDFLFVGDGIWGKLFSIDNNWVIHDSNGNLTINETKFNNTVITLINSEETDPLSWHKNELSVGNYSTTGYVNATTFSTGNLTITENSTTVIMDTGGKDFCWGAC